VYSEAKDGVDAGVLLGGEPVGVVASTGVDAVLALDADCVIYTPRLSSISEVCAILFSGKNVVTTTFLCFTRTGFGFVTATASWRPAYAVTPACTAAASIPAICPAHSHWCCRA
jgi:hypothetical protein